MNDPGDIRPRVKLAFESECVRVAVENLMPLKTLRPGTKETKKYSQIVRSIRAIGLVEPPVITPDPNRLGRYFLLDGQLRIEALKDLGIAEAECIVSTDDETYTYNKKVNRIVPVQEHRMIMRAVERGVSEAQIAEALGWEITSVRRRSRILDGICSDAAELLKDSPSAMSVFDIPAEDGTVTASGGRRADARAEQFFCRIRASIAGSNARQSASGAQKYQTKRCVSSHFRADRSNGTRARELCKPRSSPSKKPTASTICT